MTDITWAVLVTGGLGIICAGLLFIAAKVFYVFEDPRIAEVEELLPGSNCGGCGLPGCKALAEALVNGTTGITCPVNSSDGMQEIGKLLGQEIAAGEKKIAVVFCKGNISSAKELGAYNGARDCRSAHIHGTSTKLCQFGCIGFGTCINVCQYDAIIEKNGIVEIVREKCTSCGKCVEACPRNIITLAPESKDVVIACSSHDKGLLVKNYCSVGCIACKMCEKNCPHSSIHEENNLFVIDYEKCNACGECTEHCKPNTIDTLIKNVDRKSRYPEGFLEKKEAAKKEKEEKKRQALLATKAKEAQTPQGQG